MKLIKLIVIINIFFISGLATTAELSSDVQKIMKISVNNIKIKDVVERIKKNRVVKVKWTKGKYEIISLMASTSHIRNTIEFSKKKGSSEFDVRQIFLDNNICYTVDLSSTIRCLKEFEISLNRPGFYKIIRYQTAARAELSAIQKVLQKAYEKYKSYPTCLKHLGHIPFKYQRYSIGFVGHNLSANSKVGSKCGKSDDYNLKNSNKSIAVLLKKYNKTKIGNAKKDHFSLVAIKEVFVKGRFQLDVVEINEKGRVKQLTKQLLVP